ncbi:Phosphate-binding protein [Candidatus Methylobacter favarea]|uniref:Phosphate-binding protein n=1 Tax=Candidatus Methylobacter favarea TaxID=2707345 RepID=A0A8S0WIB9_9GAMM|nr:phosphate ABC transporter substrate-binding protein [Candidatus Methylobacter favarea]CAA9890454.1 Phosphate-binding protein [Candidatus Methylobacter favarea]
MLISGGRKNIIKRAKKQALDWLTGLLLILIIAGCTKNESLNAAGSTTVLPIVVLAAERFKALHGVNVIVNAGGSGVGINQLGEGKIAIGMISRNISDAEIKRYPNVNFVVHSIGKDAVVPVVSSEIYDAGIKSLSLRQIGKIYLGEITSWKQLGGPDKDILVIDKEKSRGTRHVFMEIVLGDKEVSAPGADLVLGDNNEEQTAVMQSDSAIGMLSNAWLNSDVKGLSIILQNGSTVEPKLENISNGRFPITRDLLLVTSGEPAGNIKAFIDFILSDEGQKIVRDSGYVSLEQ